MSDLPTQLAEARAAYHELQMGRSAVTFVDSNGERVEFRPANAAKLAAYIRDLERQIAGRTRPATLHPRTSKGTDS